MHSSVHAVYWQTPLPRLVITSNTFSALCASSHQFLLSILKPSANTRISWMKPAIRRTSAAAPPLAEEELESLELVLFHVNECYVYLIPPRKSVGSYRADEWNVNKWAWEGTLKVVSKGEECIIKLEDSSTGELYARGFLRKEEPHPVEPVVDSSRYFVLRVEENIGGSRVRSAFFKQGLNNRSLDDKVSVKDGTSGLKPPPPPPAPLSPVSHVQKSTSVSPTPDPVQSPTSGTMSHSTTVPSKVTTPDEERSVQNTAEDDFGDFQAAG